MLGDGDDFTTKIGVIKKRGRTACYNGAMDLRRLERWVTTALYIAGGVALVIILAKRLLPNGSLLQRPANIAAEFLTELGGIGEGLLIIIILLILGGNRIMVSIFEGVDRYREWKRKNEQLKAEAREAVLAEGRMEGRAAERAAIRARLEAKGLNPDDILPPEESDTPA